MPRKSSTRIGPGARWRSASTKRSPAATSGPSPRPLSGAASIVFSPRLSISSRISGSAAAVRTQEPRRAVVVGIVQEDDVAGPDAGARRDARSTRRVARRVQSLPQRDHSTGRQPRRRAARRVAPLKIP